MREQQEAHQHGQRDQPQVVFAHLADDDASQIGQAADVDLDVLEARVAPATPARSFIARLHLSRVRARGS